MKKLILTIWFGISCLFCYGQYYGQFGDISNKQLDKLKLTTLKVVLKKDDPFSAAFKKAVEKNWTFTKYEFINEDALSQYKEKDEVFLLGYFNGSFHIGQKFMLDVPFIGIVNKV